MELKKIKQLVIAAGLILLAMVSLSVHRYFENIKLSKMVGVNPLLISTGTFKLGLSDALYGFGLSDKEKFEICQAYSKFFDLRRLKPDDEYSVIMSTSGVFKYVSIRRDLKDYLVFRKQDSFVSTVKPVKTAVEIIKSSGVISSSLWDSMIETVPAETILDFADIFSWTVDFLTEVRKNDEYTVIYKITKTDKERVVDKKILAAAYKGSVAGEKTAVKFKDSYYNKEGESMRSMFLRAPLHYRRISSYFTHRRFHPILKYVRPHLGIDYAAPIGTPVSSVASGRVAYTGWKGGYGRFISIKHSAGYESTYAHLRSYAKGVKIGKRVKQGDVVGYVGSSGMSTGSHLDFRIKHNGKFINFLKIKYRPTKRLEKKYEKEFADLYKSLLGDELAPRADAQLDS
ncbi:MAG: M23 family metallopeptidase [Elusimicrobia bacterium]|nr:M23 family metallopeptidase [Elusimicrobiota bacterium]